MNLRWVQRNEDKPHRCPECHGIALRAWADRGYGPRTRMSCPNDCGVQWRAGSRATRRPRWIRLAQRVAERVAWAGCRETKHEWPAREKVS